MWEFRGHDGGRTIDGRRCASPSEQWKIEIAALQKLGCKFSAIERTGGAYRFTSECDLKTRRGRELTSTRRTVITLRGEQAFTLTVRGTTNGHPVDDLIVGKRVGECENKKK
jgi:hypothetical protein